MIARASTREQLIRHFPRHGTVAEIGVADGNFSAILLENTVPSSLYLIDCWEFQDDPEYRKDPANVSDERMRQNYLKVKRRFVEHDNVHVIKAYSVDAARMFNDEFFDWVYIDARHTYTEALADLHAWWPKIRPGGILAGHDYLMAPRRAIETKRAVDDFLCEQRLELSYCTTDRWPTWGIQKELAPAAMDC